MVEEWVQQGTLILRKSNLQARLSNAFELIEKVDFRYCTRITLVTFHTGHESSVCEDGQRAARRPVLKTWSSLRKAGAAVHMLGEL